MEGAVESATDYVPVFIKMPETASAAKRLAFSRCDIFAKKGSSSWQVKCTLCGRAVTTNAHKMGYGHYLQTEAGILLCLNRERLRELDQEFVQKLEAKQARLTMK